MPNVFFPKIHLPNLHHSNKNINSQIISNKREIFLNYRKNISRGLIFSVFIHLAFISSYFIAKEIQKFNPDERVVKVRILKYSDLGPPPSITQTATAPSLGISSSLKPSIGIPIPVPDAEINPENTIATQTELSQVQNPNITNENGFGSGEIKIDDSDLNEPGINDFVAVENPPQIIHAETPSYPEIARRANLEGSVWVKILVGKDGLPIKAVAMPGSANQIFEEEALAAAMKYKFTPATMAYGPVKVWVAIKFKFYLKNSPK